MWLLGSTRNFHWLSLSKRNLQFINQWFNQINNFFKRQCLKASLLISIFHPTIKFFKEIREDQWKWEIKALWLPIIFTEVVQGDRGALAEPVPQFPLTRSLYSQPRLLNQQLPPFARRNDQFCFPTLHKPITFTRLTQAESNCTYHQWKIPKPPFIF